MLVSRSFIAPLAGLLLAPLAAQAGPTVTLTPCQVPGLAQEARCGTLEVFENRAAKSGRKIGISFVVVPATGTKKATEAIFNFAGGPGDSAIRQVGGMAQGFASLRATRDLVAVDVRGTGRSAPLDCPGMRGNSGVQGFLDDFLPAARVAECRKELEKDHDLRQYTTAPSIDDVEDVRAALGYDKVDLVGGSYGTRAALVFLKRHPQHVRAALLEGVDRTSDRAPLYFARDAQAALDKVFAACAAEPKCHAAIPDPAGDFARVLAQAEKAPIEVALKDPTTGEAVRLRLSRPGLAQTVRYMLYSPPTHGLIPLYVHAAAQGNFKPLADMAQTWGRLLTSDSDGFYLSVTCAEDVPLFTTQEAEAAARGTFLGLFRVHKQQEACAAWVRGPIPAGFGDPIHSPVPVLLISGERDPVTPASAGEGAARTLPNSLHLVVPAGAHGSEGLVGADCVERLAVEFLEKGSARGLDTSCVAGIHAQPFQTELPSETEIEVPAAELAKLVGTYSAPGGGLSMAVRLVDGRLKVEVAGQPPLPLTAVAPGRFKVEGVPPGFFVTFAPLPDGGMAATLEEGAPTQTERLERQAQ